MTLAACDIRDGYTVAELADEMDRSQRTVRRWIATYRIRPVGHTANVHRYALADVLRAEHDTRKRRASSLLGGFTTV